MQHYFFISTAFWYLVSFLKIHIYHLAPIFAVCLVLILGLFLFFVYLSFVSLFYLLLLLFLIRICILKYQSNQRLQNNPLASLHGDRFKIPIFFVNRMLGVLTYHCNYIPWQIHVLRCHGVLKGLLYQSLEAVCRSQICHYFPVKRTGHIVGMVARCILFSHDGNMMICAIHCRTHQVSRHASTIYSLWVCFSWIAVVTRTAIRSHHKTSHLGINCHLPFLPGLATLHRHGIRLLRSRMSLPSSPGLYDSTPPERLMKSILTPVFSLIYYCLNRVLPVSDNSHWLRCYLLKRHRFQTFCIFSFNILCPSKIWSWGKSVFCITRIVHNTVADLKYTARIVTAADGFRYIADRLF